MQIAQDSCDKDSEISTLFILIPTDDELSRPLATELDGSIKYKSAAEGPASLYAAIIIMIIKPADDRDFVLLFLAFSVNKACSILDLDCIIRLKDVIILFNCSI